MTLETKIGRLSKVLPEFELDTIQHAAEISNERRTHPNRYVREELIKNWFWTADFSIYRIEDGEAVLYLGDITTNLIFENIGKAKIQLKEDKNYFPSRKDIQRVLGSVETGNTLRIELSDLGLETHKNRKNSNNEYSYFEINTSDYNNTLNETQREFAERIYGQGEDFIKNMKMLSEAGIEATKIYVLNPDYIKRNVRGYSAIARTCCLFNFEGSSDFCAAGRDIKLENSGLRGVVKPQKQ